MNESSRRSLGALLGASVGTAGYWYLLTVDVHALALVGAGLALGVALTSRTRSLPWSLLTALLAVGVSLAVESWFRPFRADPSFGFFLTHLTELSRNSLLSLGVVAAMGLWFGGGRRRGNGAPRTNPR